MLYENMEHKKPRLFRQGPSALSKLLFFCALALFLMLADLRFQVTQPVRAALATLLYPVQWVAIKPAEWTHEWSSYFKTMQTLQATQVATEQKLLLQSQRTNQVDSLILENTQLRQLLDLRERTVSQQQIAEVLFEAADPYTQRLVLSKGAQHGIVQGSPVIDDSGVLGQITRVYPLTSEVTLLINRDHATPVLNVRTGVRSVAYGDSNTSQGGFLELRFISANADIVVGDLLTTSGIDGVYPAGLPVARLETIERQVASTFARVTAKPVAKLAGLKYVMVLHPPETAPMGPPKPVFTVE